jgi:hypothetical protein
MAQFRGSIQGQRGEASRLGSKGSGLQVEAASWQGAVNVEMWYDERQDRDMFRVEQTPHHGRGINQHLLQGVVGEPLPGNGGTELIRDLWSLLQAHTEGRGFSVDEWDALRARVERIAGEK